MQLLALSVRIFQQRKLFFVRVCHDVHVDQIVVEGFRESGGGSWNEARILLVVDEDQNCVAHCEETPSV